MKKYLVVGFAAVLLGACGGGAGADGEKTAPVTEAGMIAALKTYEDSLKKASTDISAAENRAISEDYAERCLAIYQKYPKSPEAPKYLDKAHMIYSGAGLHGRAVTYADTLIRKYPAYKNRPMVLQSLATSYDMFVVPRNKDKVKYYYELLLTENPNLPEEEKENIRFRLENIDLTFDQLVSLQVGNAGKK